jgi:hypothetical protein
VANEMPGPSEITVRTENVIITFSSYPCGITYFI